MRILWAVALATTACGFHEDRAQDTTRTDSAGVTIASTPLGDRPSLVVLDTLFDYGGVDAQEIHQFHVISDALLLPDGFAVLDSGFDEVRVFDEDGSLRWRSGRTGEGPGEFTAPTELARYRDSLFIYDRGLRRGTVLDPRGEVERTLTLRFPELGPVHDAFPIGADGGIVGVYTRPPRSEIGQISGQVTVPARYGLFDPDGSFLDDLGSAPGDERFFVSVGSRRYFTYRLPLYARREVSGTFGEQLLLSPSDHWEFLMIDVARRDSTFVRLAGVDLTLPQAEVDQAWREWTSATAGPAPSQTYDLPYPTRRPPLGAILSDPGGRIWALDFFPLHEHPRLWRIFDPDGDYVATFTPPEGSYILDISGQNVLGTYADDLDIQHIQLLRVGPGNSE